MESKTKNIILVLAIIAIIVVCIGLVVFFTNDEKAVPANGVQVPKPQQEVAPVTDPAATSAEVIDPLENMDPAVKEKIVEDTGEVVDPASSESMEKVISPDAGVDPAVIEARKEAEKQPVTDPAKSDNVIKP